MIVEYDQSNSKYTLDSEEEYHDINTYYNATEIQNFNQVCDSDLVSSQLKGLFIDGNLEHFKDISRIDRKLRLFQACITLDSWPETKSIW